jgi:WD40 repeat protein
MSIDQAMLIRISNKSPREVYNFQNFIRTDMPMIDNSNLLQNKVLKYTDKNSNTYFKTAKTKGVLFDIHVLNQNYNQVEELLITNGTGRAEIFLFNNEKNYFQDVVTLTDDNEDFSCMDYYKVILDNEDKNYYEYIIVMGGETNIIRVFSFRIHITNIDNYEIMEFKTLIGHRDSINDLKINPIYNDLVLSASKDNSVRVWNYLLGTQLAIFAGKEGHEVMVLSIDWHFTGKTFCSGGGDRIRIWELSKELIEINENYEDKNKDVKLPLLCPFPIYSIDIHCSYVDSIIYLGDIILSKSLSDNGGEIVEWAPIRFNDLTKKENDISKNMQSIETQGFCYIIVNKYEFPLEKIGDKLSKIFYFKMSYSEELDSIIVGNNQGNIYLFKRNTEIKDSMYKKIDNIFYELKPIEPSLEIFMIDGTIRKAIIFNNIVY